ncbi:MAG: preprotein translocase subunit SecE [Planctomycetota bacterium]|nr:preprotein translocase subunit SecE [Planctomycetota bacterium]
MNLGIYKKNQGYYTRVCTAFSLATIVLMGSQWLWDMMGGISIGTLQPVYIQAGGSVLFISLFGILGYYLIGVKPKVVDFMIATEGEMKKVNWSTKREIFGSTWAVIGLTMLIALLCFTFDLVFQLFFQALGVLKDAGS